MLINHMNAAIPELVLAQSQKESGEAYLKLQLNDRQHAILPIQFSQQVLVVPANRLTHMPNMPSCMLGLLNQRSRVFWVADLPQMLGLNPIPADVHLYNIAIIQVQKAALALAVQAIKGVRKFNPESIESPIGAVASEIVPYLRGCIPEDGEMLLVLDPEAIANSTALR